ncbi:peptidoglycan DD-metalloendopeptidase family protein [Paenibacillus thiaminolyticus]|uniref:M23 family metallopeptidase n=1 Tax=Paenibacillus thiaminolyticus TaxID=49283 RepID=UPI00232B60FB|nr:M23 family metallopeptidase [Paenibacillus thiaminolyticus]WCF07528.1 peptidoglycan DD-metalloendopeptidase family protein [Paenibacillus thiaminolyticus]
MKGRWWNGRMTLLVIRDAEQAVKQMNVPKMLVVSVPIAAVLSISGLVLSMQWKAAAEISELEGMLAHQSEALEVTVKNKDEAIQRLQNEIIRLSSETETVKQRLNHMSSLEKQLEDFVEGTSAVPQESGEEQARFVQSTAWNEQRQVGGEEIGVGIEQMLELAKRSRLDLIQMQRMLSSIQRSAPAVLNQAQRKQELIAGTPSVWPTKSRRLTSSFGYRKDPLTGYAAFHAGIDIGGETGDSVLAAAEGEVIEASFNTSRGNYIIIRHVNQLDTWYMHLQQIHVSVGDQVGKGDIIGALGTTGRSTGPHLHFQIVERGDPIDPLPFLSDAAAEDTPAEGRPMKVSAASGASGSGSSGPGRSPSSPPSVKRLSPLPKWITGEAQAYGT